MKSKHDTFNKFKELKSLVENQTGRHIRVLRIDNGGEFVSHDFDDLFQDTGIKRELTILTSLNKMGLRKGKT